MSIKVYKAKDFAFTVSGIIVGDIAKDGDITISYDDDKVTKTLDTNVGGLYSVSSSNAGTITIPLMQSSAWLMVLADMAVASVPFPILAEDKNNYANKMKFICEKAMIKQIPTPSYGETAKTVEVVFDCINLKVVTLPTDLIPTF